MTYSSSRTSYNNIKKTLKDVLTQDLNLNDDYKELSKNYIQYNDTISAELIKNINLNLSELNLVQNEINVLSNLNKEALFKKEEILKLKNEELMDQLRSLESIQSGITTKDRLIEQTNKHIENQDLNIIVLASLIGFGVILFIIINLKGLGVIGEKQFTLAIIVQFTIFIVGAIYAYNIFYFKDAVTYLFDRRNLRILNQLKEMAKKETENLYGKEDEWIDENCDCPFEEDTYAYYYNGQEAEKHGYFYYDGSSPQQLIVDLPTKNDVYSEYDEKIYWVDYSQDGKPMYNPKTKKMSYDNKQYYNYNKEHDPSILLSKVLEEQHILVDNVTNTANI